MEQNCNNYDLIRKMSQTILLDRRSLRVSLHISRLIIQKLELDVPSQKEEKKAGKKKEKKKKKKKKKKKDASVSHIVCGTRF